MILLRAAERFGVDPYAFIAGLSAGEEAEMVAYAVVRDIQERRDAEALGSHVAIAVARMMC